MLEIYDQISAAKQAGHTYQTRLKPAPPTPLLPFLYIAVSHGPAAPARSRMIGKDAVTDPSRTFAVGSDEALVGLIGRARNCLVVIAPALTRAVADALSHRFDELGRLDVAVILESDPEVYRLGFGDQAALETIRAASANSLLFLVDEG